MNFKKKTTNILFILLLISACSTKKIHVNNTVELTSSTIEENVAIAQNYQLLAGGYGPQPPEQFLDYSNKNHTKTWGMVVLPARARVFELVKFLKLLEEKNMQANLMVTYEYSSLLMLAYGHGLKVGELEWMIYKSLTDEVSDMETWSKNFQKTLLGKINSKKLENTKPIIVIPTWDTSLSRPVLNESGPVDALLKLTTLEYKSFKNNIPAWVKNIDYEAMRSHYSLDKMVVLDFFGDKLLFKQNNDYLHGVYGAYLSIKNKSKIEMNDNIIYIDLSSLSHDQDAMPLAVDFLKAPTNDFRIVIDDLYKKLNEGI